jgi:hypothetical protein
VPGAGTQPASCVSPCRSRDLERLTELQQCDEQGQSKDWPCSFAASSRQTDNRLRAPKCLEASPQNPAACPQFTLLQRNPSGAAATARVPRRRGPAINQPHVRPLRTPIAAPVSRRAAGTSRNQPMCNFPRGRVHWRVSWPALENRAKPQLIRFCLRSCLFHECGHHCLASVDPGVTQFKEPL